MVRNVINLLGNDYQHSSVNAKRIKKNKFTPTKEQEKTTQKTTDEDTKKMIESSYKKLTSASGKLRALIQEQNATLKERIEKGEEEPSIRIGGKSMTVKEWQAMLKKVDTVVENHKETMKKINEEQEVKKQQTKVEQKKEEEKRL